MQDLIEDVQLKRPKGGPGYEKNEESEKLRATHNWRKDARISLYEAGPIGRKRIPSWQLRGISRCWKDAC
jgi:hypothetical protein